MPEEEQANLAAAILEESGRIIRERYDADLIVLLLKSRQTDRVKTLLAERGISTVQIEDILLEPYGPETDLIPGVDDHPNARGHHALGIDLANYWNATNGLQ